MERNQRKKTKLKMKKRLFKAVFVFFVIYLTYNILYAKMKL